MKSLSREDSHDRLYGKGKHRCRRIVGTPTITPSFTRYSKKYENRNWLHDDDAIR